MRAANDKAVAAGRRRTLAQSQSCPLVVERRRDDELSFVVAWGATAHLNQGADEKAKRQASLKSLGEDTAVASRIAWRSDGAPVVAAVCGEAATVVLDADGGCVAFVTEGDRRVRRLKLRVADAAVGDETGLLVDKSGRLYRVDARCWEKPTLMPGGLAAAVVACGARHCLVATRSGELYAWGEATAGQLGQGDEPEHLRKARREPVRVLLIDEDSKPVRVKRERGAVACGAHHSATISIDDRLWTWGWSEHGRLGRATTTQSVCHRSSSSSVASEDDDDGRPCGVPRVVNTHKTFKSVACGSCHTLALSGHGEVYGCGWNEYGQACGRTTGRCVASFTQVSFERRMRRMRNDGDATPFHAVSIAAGLAHSVALDIKGVAMAWGFGEDGQLGGGSEESSFTPVQIVPRDLGSYRFAAIAAAGTYSVAIAAPEEACLAFEIEAWRKRAEAELRAAVQLQRHGRALIVAQRKRADAVAVGELREATRLAAYRGDGRSLAAALTAYRAHVLLDPAASDPWRVFWCRRAGAAAERDAAEILRRIEARRALSVAMGAVVESVLEERDEVRGLARLDAAIASARAVADKDIDVEAYLVEWSASGDWRDSFEPFERAIAARTTLERRRASRAVTSLASCERRRAARARSRVALEAGRQIVDFAVRTLCRRRAKAERRRRHDECRRDAAAAVVVTRIVRAVVRIRRFERARLDEERRQAREVADRAQAAFLVTSALRRAAARRRVRLLRRIARDHRRRLLEEEKARREEEEARRALQAAKRRKSREERERRQEVDARLAREAVRNASKLLRQLEKRDSDAADAAAKAATEARRRADRDRDRARWAKAANERRRLRDEAARASFDDSKYDEGDPGVDATASSEAKECTDESEEDVVQTFPEYAEALKARARRRSSLLDIAALHDDDNELPNVKAEDAAPQRRNSLAEFRTVEQWAARGLSKKATGVSSSSLP